MMSEFIFASFIVVLLGTFTAIFEGRILRGGGNLHLLAAFGSLALGGAFQIASVTYPGLSVFSEGLKSWALILFGFSFLGGREGRGKSRALLIFLLSLSFLIAFGPKLIGALDYLIGIRLWQAALAATLIVFVFQRPCLNKGALAAIFFLWFIMAIWKRGDFQALAQLLAYLGLLLLVYKNILFNFRRLESSKAHFVKEKEVILSFLERIGVALHEAFDLEEALKMIMSCVMASSQAKAGAIFLLSNDKKTLTVDVVEGLFPPLHKTTAKATTKTKYIMEQFKTARIKIGEGVIGRVAATGSPILIKDALRDSRTPETSADFLQIKTMVVAPLKIKEEVLGVIALVNKENEERFSEADASLLHALGNQAAISINNAKLYQALSEKERLEQELQIARDIQGLLFPREAPRIEGFELASLARPAMEVGGDYYDYIEVGKDEWGLAIADVSGKGVPGALVMAMTRSMLRAEAVGKSSAAQVLSRVNKSIYEDIKEDMFVSLFYLVLNVRKGILNYARAGHEPAILFRGKERRYELLDGGGMALGLDGGSVFNETLEWGEVKLSSGDILVLYTDGIIEAVNENNEEFGFQRLLEIVRQSSLAEGEESASALVERVDQEIAKFASGVSQRDDITLVVLRVK